MNRFLKVSATSLICAFSLMAMATEGSAASRTVKCKAYAQKYAAHIGGTDAVNGLVLGAAAGGLYGAITGHGASSNIATGLAVGGIGGTMFGAISGAERKKKAYRKAFKSCMNSY